MSSVPASSSSCLALVLLCAAHGARAQGAPSPRAEAPPEVVSGRPGEARAEDEPRPGLTRPGETWPDETRPPEVALRETEADLETLAADGLLDEEEAALAAWLVEGAAPSGPARVQLSALPGLSRMDVEALVRAQEAGEPAPLAPAQRALLTPLLRMLHTREEGLSARVRLSTVLAPGAAPRPPPAVLAARLQVGPSLSAGLLLAATRQRLGAVRWEVQRHALVASAPAPGLHLAKVHARLSLGALEVLAGHFRVGFAQRLTLDTTGLPQPDGALPDVEAVAPGPAPSACPGEEGGVGCPVPDFGWREGFRGVAATLREVALAPGWALSASAFASLAPRTPLQGELSVGVRCASAGGACPGPALEVTLPGGAATRWSRASLPRLVEEATAGGRLALAAGGGGLVGITGYGAVPRWSAQGLDYRASSRFPAGGPFGGVGLDGALTVGALTLLAEAARSFDAAPGGGGDVALLQRTVVSGPGEELEVALRYYGPAYDNPYARPPAAPDEEEGLRARDEAGVRVSALSHALEPWQLRGSVDAWVRPSDLSPAAGGALRPSLSAQLRVDGAAAGSLAPTLQLAYAHRAGCDTASAGCSAHAGPVHALRTAGRLQLRVHPAWVLGVMARHALESMPRGPARHGGRAGLELSVRPHAALRVAARARWEAEDLVGPAAPPPATTGALELDCGPLWGLRAHARYELSAREPRHRVRLDVEARW